MHPLVTLFLIILAGMLAGADVATNPCGLMSVHAEQGRVYMLAGDAGRGDVAGASRPRNGESRNTTAEVPGGLEGVIR